MHPLYKVCLRTRCVDAFFNFSLQELAIKMSQENQQTNRNEQKSSSYLDQDSDLMSEDEEDAPYKNTKSKTAVRNSAAAKQGKKESTPEESSNSNETAGLPKSGSSGSTSKNCTKYSCFCKYLSVVIPVVIGLISFLCYSSTQVDRSVDNSELVNVFFKQHEHQLSKPAQSVIRSAFEKSTKTSDPVVLLLISSMSQHEKLKNISTEIGILFAEVFRGELFEHSLTKEDTGLNVESLYSDTFKMHDSGRNVLLLHDLQNYSLENIMTFHQYVDGEDSRIKSTFTIMTLTSPDDSLFNFNGTADFKDFQETSTSVLSSLWKNYRGDFHCLINRIAKYPIVFSNN